MNIVPAELSEHGGVMTATVRGGSFPLGAGLAAAARRRGLMEALVGARPDSLRVTPQGTVDATVSLVESFGREHHAACRLNGGQLVSVRIDEKETELRTGDAVKIGLVGDLHLFEPSRGERIRCSLRR